MKKYNLTYCIIALFSLLLITSDNLIAQVITEKRIEFEVTDDSKYLYSKIYPFGAAGLIIYKKENKNNIYKLEHYNTDFNPSFQKEFELPKGFALTKIFTNTEYLYQLYEDLNENFVLYRFNASDLSFNKAIGSLPQKSTLVAMAASGDFAYITLNSKEGPLILKVNNESGNSEIIPISAPAFTTEDLSVSSIEVIESTGDLLIYYTAINKNENNFYVMHVGLNGKINSTINLTAIVGFRITGISANQLSEDKFIFTGTYMTNVATSDGIYICKTNGYDIDFIERYKLSELENFFSYLPTPEEQKVAKKNGVSGVNNAADWYFMADHTIIKVGDNYLKIAEAYYPTYSVDPTLSFSGFKYTHVLLSMFDNLGKKLWDRTFKMETSYNPLEVIKFISVKIVNDEINLLFSGKDDIFSIAYNLEGDQLRTDKAPLKVDKENSYIEDPFNKITFWYDFNFIAYGYQTFRDDNQYPGSKKRTVFFINKITYD